MTKQKYIDFAISTTSGAVLYGILTGLFRIDKLESVFFGCVLSICIACYIKHLENREEKDGNNGG